MTRITLGDNFECYPIDMQNLFDVNIIELYLWKGFIKISVAKSKFLLRKLCINSIQDKDLNILSINHQIPRHIVLEAKFQLLNQTSFDDC